jgi:bacteriocin biosynthesis cyclodehydratase domain-containing protein
MPDDDSGETAEIRNVRTTLADPNFRFPQRPRLADDTLVYVMPDGLGVQVRGVVEPMIVRGGQASAAIQFISSMSAQGLTLDEILNAAPSTVPQIAILRAFVVLHSRGLIIDAAADGSRPNSGAALTLEDKAGLFWSRHLGISGSCVSAAALGRSVASHTIALLGNGLFCALLLEALIRSGFANVVVLNWRGCATVRDAFSWLGPSLRRGEHIEVGSAMELSDVLRGAREPDLFVTALRIATDDVFEAVNRLCLRNQWPCLKGAETPESFEIGPFVQPYDSACLTCAHLRRRSAMDFPIEEKLFQDYFKQARASGTAETAAFNGEAAASALVPVGMLAMECIRIATAISLPTLLNSQITFKPLSGEITKNRILRVPHCPDCGSS